MNSICIYISQNKFIRIINPFVPRHVVITSQDQEVISWPNGVNSQLKRRLGWAQSLVTFLYAGIIYIGRPLRGSREKRKSDSGVRLPIQDLKNVPSCFPGLLLKANSFDTDSQTYLEVYLPFNLRYLRYLSVPCSRIHRVHIAGEGMHMRDTHGQTTGEFPRYHQMG